MWQIPEALPVGRTTPSFYCIWVPDASRKANLNLACHHSAPNGKREYGAIPSAS
jgi:hypothetical protein